MKTLADFKRRLQEAQQKKTRVKTILSNQVGQIIRDSEPAPIGLVQSHQFALDRNGEYSYCEFGKVANWSFTPTVATRKLEGGTLTIEFLTR